MRLLHVYAGNLYGGVETLLVTLAATRPQRPTLTQEFALCYDGRLKSELTQCGALVHPLRPVRMSRPWTVVAARQALLGICDRTHPDAVLVHSFWSHVVFTPALLRRRLPVALAVHDVPTGRHWIERLAARVRPTLIVANSRHCLEAATRLFPQTASAVYHGAVPMPSPSSPTARAETRKAFGVAPDAVVVLMACRLEPWKGHGALIEALGGLRDVAGWRCWITTPVQRPHEAEYLAALSCQLAALGLTDRVRFLGERRDVPALMAAADIYCQPNKSPEPFGRVFVEALSTGLPVVSTAIGGAQEIVTPACGVLVPPDHPEALAGALRRLITDPTARKTLGAHGRPRAVELCEPQVAIELLEKMMGSMLAHKTDGRR